MKYKTRNGKIIEANPAVNMEGCLLATRNTIFRTYHNDGAFTDYELHHYDPSIKFIDSGIYIYSDGVKQWLDYSPEALGFEEVK